jgi:hypothetical protein
MWKKFAFVLTGICWFLAVSTLTADKPKADDAFIGIGRFSGGDGGNFDRFTVAKDGSWEFKPQGGASKKGKLSAEVLNKWVKEIEDAGLYRVKSDPLLGDTAESYLDRSFMDITVQAKGKKAQVRILLGEKVSQAIEKKIVELAKPGW